MQKIRISMGHRDDKYQLDEFVEMDEGFFEGIVLGKISDLFSMVYEKNFT